MAELKLARPKQLAWLLLLVIALRGGCSGLAVSKSISPLDFLLPGLLQNDPPAPATQEVTNAVACRYVSPLRLAQN